MFHSMGSIVILLLFIYSLSLIYDYPIWTKHSLPSRLSWPSPTTPHLDASTPLSAPTTLSHPTYLSLSPNLSLPLCFNLSTLAVVTFSSLSSVSWRWRRWDPLYRVLCHLFRQHWVEIHIDVVPMMKLTNEPWRGIEERWGWARQ